MVQALLAEELNDRRLSFSSPLLETGSTEGRNSPAWKGGFNSPEGNRKPFIEVYRRLQERCGRSGGDAEA
jgi:hypothetical protein